MARVRKRRFQVIRNIVLGALIFIMLGTLLGGLARSVIIFMLTGFIAGTNITIPVWGMFALYAAILLLILFSYALDRELERRYLAEELQKEQLNRRYSHS